MGLAKENPIEIIQPRTLKDYRIRHIYLWYTSEVLCLYVQLHGQGATLSCLAKSMSSLAALCKLQILRVAELQADDYHKDRQLFLACRNDRETVCRDVKAGGGAVYKCLYKHKFDQTMSRAVSLYCYLYFCALHFLACCCRPQ